MGYTSSRIIIIWWDPKTEEIKYANEVKFNEYSKRTQDGTLSIGENLQQGNKILRSSIPDEFIDVTDHVFIYSPAKFFVITIPPNNVNMGIQLAYCETNNLCYITHSLNNKPFAKQIPALFRHNVWILSLENKNSSSITTVQQVLKSLQTTMNKKITIILAKQKIPTITPLSSIRSMFHRIK